MPRLGIICTHVLAAGVWVTACAAQGYTPSDGRVLQAPSPHLRVDGPDSADAVLSRQPSARPASDRPARVSPRRTAGNETSAPIWPETAGLQDNPDSQAFAEPARQQADAGGLLSPGDAAANSPRSIELPRQSAAEPMSLAPRESTSSNLAAPTIPSLATVFGSLGIVLGLFLLAAWAMRRKLANGAASLPTGVVQLLGCVELPGRHQLQLIRCGSKLLLLSVSAGVADTLTEITDPVEVDRLAGLCQQQDGHSSTFVFSQVLKQFGKESSDRGFAAVGADSKLDLRTSSIPAHNGLPESSNG